MLPGIFRGYALIALGIWKGDILVADIEELEKLDASDIHPRRINPKEVLTPQRGEDFIFPTADGTAKLSGRDYEFREPILRWERTVRSEDHSGELQGELEDTQPTETKDDAEARADLWSIQGDSICRYHIEPGVQLYVPKGTWHAVKIGQERVHRKASSKSLNLTSAVRALPDLRTQDETLHQERCARRVAWDLTKNVYKLKSTQKAAFCSSFEARATPAPTSTSPEERKLVVDSGASMHMLSRKDLSSDKLETLQRSRTTHNGGNGQG